MTAQNLTPVLPEVQSPYLKLAAAEVAATLEIVAQARTNIAGLRAAVADWQTAIVAAQRAGDAAFDQALDYGCSGEVAAERYHLSYQRSARQSGCGPVCECSLCQGEFEMAKGGDETR